jgi:PTH1 family peptidyl-tRNA hydrolase
MKVVAGLGNPGSAYDDTRHNVGWWMVDRLAFDWGFGAFEREGRALQTEGARAGETVRLTKPATYMNRSGAALAPLRGLDEFEVVRDLLVVVDDATLDVGRVRFRPGGGAGGHNGLRSVEAALGTREYARLRIGVGIAPSGGDLSEWVLSSMPPDDEEVVLRLLPELTEAVDLWITEGVEAAMNRFNR